jgi:amphi-Trp domain-containing protein
MRRTELISWLERFAEQLRSGTLLVDGEALRVPEEFEAKVKSKAKKRRRRLGLKLEWEETDVPAARQAAEASLTPPPETNGKGFKGYEAHVLVCCGGDCRKRGSRDLKKVFKREFRSQGVRRVKVSEVDCLGLCKKGPNAVVYPASGWHTGVKQGQVPQIVARHIGMKPEGESSNGERAPVRRA